MKKECYYCGQNFAEITICEGCYKEALLLEDGFYIIKRGNKRLKIDMIGNLLYQKLSGKEWLNVHSQMWEDW